MDFRVMDRGVVFEPGTAGSCHAATIAVRPDGGEVVAWFAGTAEGAPDVAIWTAHRGPSPASAGAWSEPVVAARARGVPCWNPVLHVAGERLLLFYKAGPSPQTWSGRVTVSRDGGRTWGERAALPPGIVGPAKNKPLAMPGGRLLCPSSTESHLAWGVWIEETDDELAGWTKHGPIHRPGIGMIQPALVPGEAAGTIVGLCRTANAGRVARIESFDGGRSWVEPELLDVPHNNSGLDAVRVDDTVVLVANAVTEGRSPLHLLASDDQGRTFPTSMVIDDTAGELSYPAIVDAGGGDLRLVYTNRRETISYARVSARG